MWNQALVVAAAGGVILILGITIGVASVMLGARLVARFSRGQSVLTGRSQPLESLPFIIKDDATERRLEDQALGYKQLTEFDSIEGLGR